MGQSLKTLVPGSDAKKAKEIEPIINEFYVKRLESAKEKGMSMTFGDFYHAVCGTVEEINRKLGNTQFELPKVETLEKVFTKYHGPKGKNLNKEDYKEILKEVIAGLGVTGIGAKESLFYIFGVPVAALLVKQGVMPRAIRNEFFIPGVTSLTVLVLASLNKI